MGMPAATMKSISLGKTVGPHVWLPTRPSKGVSKVLVEGMPILNIGCEWYQVSCSATHTPPISVIPPDTHKEICFSGSSKVLVAGMPVCRFGDDLVWGDKIWSGSSKVLIGG